MQRKFFPRKEIALVWVAGADGCPAGWMVVLRDLSGAAPPRLRIAPRFADLLAAPEKPAVVAVDMPIGLPERIGPAGRGPERLVRSLLGERRSSVFAIPSRRAVEAPDYGAACAAALASSDPPRKVSRQAFFLFAKIREIDALLRADPSLCARVFESHPEVAFWAMNGERPLATPKKILGRLHEAGLAERRAILLRIGLSQALVGEAPPRGGAADDLVDAIALSAVAERLLEGEALSFPDPPLRDAHGLPIAIHA